MPTPVDISPEWQDEPWTMLPGETMKAFRYFRIYRDLGPDRSVAKAARVVADAEHRDALAAAGTPTEHAETATAPTDLFAKVAARLRGYAAAGQWVRRAEAFDRETDLAKLRAERDAMRKSVETHAKIGRMVYTLAATRLQKAAEEIVADMSPGELLEYVRGGIKIEREALGVDGIYQAAVRSGERQPGSEGRPLLSLDDLEAAIKTAGTIALPAAPEPTRDAVTARPQEGIPDQLPAEDVDPDGGGGGIPRVP